MSPVEPVERIYIDLTIEGDEGEIYEAGPQIGEQSESEEEVSLLEELSHTEDSLSDS